MSSILFRNGVIHSPADPFAEALLIEDGVITWLGADDSAAGFVSRADEVVDLNGLLVTAGFVDAHVHLLATGLALEGVPLTTADGVCSSSDLLTAVRARASVMARGEENILYGHGWDETAWDDSALPALADLDSASGGLPVLLVRTDVHSSLASPALVDQLGLDALPGWDASGQITGEAHNCALAALTRVAPGRHEELTNLALRQAARAGIVSVHEMGTAELDSRGGLADLILRTSTAASGLPLVVGYWGELCENEATADEIKTSIPGLSGIAGDLCVDGSIGSHTAALTSPYADLADEAASGTLQLTADQIAAHIVATSQVGLQAGFHVIGDAAMREVLAGFTAAAAEIGAARIRNGGHRIEHAEMIDADGIDALVALGLGLSMQPAFDDAWGGPGQLYETRLGSVRAAQMNPWADLAAAGVPIAFGSDSPVTDLNPWRGVRSALLANSEQQRISARAAFRAHTRAGWRLARLDHTGAGEIRVGSPAHLAFWDAPNLAVQGPDRMFANWSTDARAGTALLPELGPDIAPPRCVRTMRDGTIIHDELV